MYVRSKRRPHLLLVSSIGMTTPGHDLDRYRRLRVIPRTRDPRIRSNARDAHGNPDLLADLALRWVDEAVDGWFERAGRRVARIDGGGVEVDLMSLDPSVERAGSPHRQQ